MQRRYALIDKLLIAVNQGLAITANNKLESARHNPAAKLKPTELDNNNKRRSQGMMRVNHSGEIAAQALYQGQALTARDPALVEKLKTAADEEIDHLAWCQQRLEELGSRQSYLTPVWYFGSLAIGTAIGILGDKWSLGFLEETENQVVTHLQNHLYSIPANDSKSRAIIKQMKIDEAEHASLAADSGAAKLPIFAKTAMKCCAKVMTTSAYYV